MGSKIFSEVTLKLFRGFPVAPSMKQNSKSPIQFKTTTPSFLIAIPLLLACFALSPMARAVSPAPAGGYPGENTAEGESPAAVSAVSTAPQLEGTWRSTVTITGGPSFSALNSINGGGTYFEADEIQLLPPSAGPAVGVWTKVGSNRYAFTWESYLFDLDTNMPAGKLQIRGLITLIDRNHYTAEVHFTFYDVDGNPTADGCATEVATRMTVEPFTPCPAGPSQSGTYPDRGSKPATGWKSLLP
jgi:hypothetical protein